MNYNFNIVLETRMPKKNGKYPIKLRLTIGKKQRYHALPLNMTNGVSFEATKIEWDRIQKQSVRGRLQDIKLQIPVIISEAEKAAKKLNPLSFEAFRDEFFNSGNQSKTLHGYFENYIESLIKEGRVSTAESYQCAFNSFKAFDPQLDFQKVTPELLNQYERWFTAEPNDGEGKPKSQTTVGIYTRSLRTIFNLAKRDGLEVPYPFGRGKFTPPAGRNIKKALSLEDIQKLVKYEAVPKSPYDQARDLFLFSYFSNGINFMDLCNIKEKDIVTDGDVKTIQFVRSKTKNSRKSNQKKIEILLIDETAKILEKYGKLKNDPENYVFPFFQKGFTPLQKRKAVQNLVHVTNKYLRRISETVGIRAETTTYFARYSFASILKESGAPVEYISEALGHADLQTTENYLKSFGITHRQKWADALRGNLSPNTNNNIEGDTTEEVDRDLLTNFNNDGEKL